MVAIPGWLWYTFADLMSKIPSWGRGVLVGGYLGEKRARENTSVLGVRIRGSVVTYDEVNVDVVCKHLSPVSQYRHWFRLMSHG